ncbi:hypothetical protein [Spirulina subsalsa]|uniref:hypothetical protein n=1 Tax=Spirulina subsalsa TaxID=54311 RepID=UPI000474DE70
MSYNQFSHSIPAPCIVDTGLIVNKDDMRRLLSSLGRVRYIHTLDDQVQNQGEGCILEVFTDPSQATLIANRALYINVCSFDYLHLHQSPEGDSFFDLVQENRQLRLISLGNPLNDPESSRNLDEAALEAMLTQVLSAKWDVQMDDEDDCPF